LTEDCRIRQRIVEFDNVFLNLANKKYLDSKKVLKCREWDLISPTMVYKDRLRPLNLHKYMYNCKNFYFVNKQIVRTSMRPVIFQWKSIHFTLNWTQKRPIKRANLLHICIWISKEQNRAIVINKLNFHFPKEYRNIMHTSFRR
jgi:hypothetical protein